MQYTITCVLGDEYELELTEDIRLQWGFKKNTVLFAKKRVKR